MLLQAYLYSSLIVFIYMTVVFGIAQLKKNNGIADIAWGIGFILVALFTFFTYGNYFPRQIIATTLVLIWGIRISGYLLLRNWNKPEDPRYQKMRLKWGNREALFSFLHVFMLQGVILLIIMMPVVIINCSYSDTFCFIDALALMIWITGFLCESIGDYQKRRFLQQPNNTGHIMMQGLWKYTRHPNYFGEATMWWGIWILALAVPYGALAIVSPLLLTFLLLYVSGVPLAEEPFKNNIAYQEYAQRTSSFIPWPPKGN